MNLHAEPGKRARQCSLQERWLRGPTEGGSVSAGFGALSVIGCRQKAHETVVESSLCQKRSKEWGDRGKVPHCAGCAHVGRRLHVALRGKTPWHGCGQQSPGYAVTILAFPGLLLEASKPIPLAARREEVGYRSHRRSSYKTRLRHELAEMRGVVSKLERATEEVAEFSLFHWFIDWFIHSLLHSFIHACVHALMHWFIDFFDSLIRWFLGSLWFSGGIDSLIIGSLA